jgi:pyridoxal/pyridoxine/pyridoxamine kinase
VLTERQKQSLLDVYQAFRAVHPEAVPPAAQDPVAGGEGE